MIHMNVNLNNYNLTGTYMNVSSAVLYNLHMQIEGFSYINQTINYSRYTLNVKSLLLTKSIKIVSFLIPY